jgi:zinc protease
MRRSAKCWSRGQHREAHSRSRTEHGAWFDWDAGGLYARTLSNNAEASLKVLADAWLNPTFPQEELERLRTRRLTSLAQEKNNPGAMAQNALAVAVFGRGHPYGNPLFGQERDIKSMTRQDIVDLHAELKRSAPMTLIAVGDLDRAKVDGWIASAFADALTRRTVRAPTAIAAAPAAPATQAVYFVHMPKATQSTVLLGTTGVRMSTPDRYAVTVMNAVFGGTFASRVNMNLREKHAYTYGARSRFSMRRGVGPFSAGGAMVADHTGDALRELLVEAKKMTEAEPTTDELSLAKNGLRLSLPGRFQTASDVASGLADLPVYGLADTEFDTWSTQISAVAGADALRVAKAYLKSFRIVIVGDREKVLPQIEPLKLGKVIELDPFGEPAKADTAVMAPAKDKKK